MRDRLTNELVAVKFIERGDKVRGVRARPLLHRQQQPSTPARRG